MMWARLTGTLIFLASGVISAQSANENVGRLESCFEMARIAGEICSKLPNDPALRLDCFQKTRAGQLECLEHALSAVNAATPVPREPLGSQGGPPVQERRSKEVSKTAGGAGPITTPAESNLLRGSDGSPAATAETRPPQQPGSSAPATIPTETSRVVSPPDRPSPPSNAAVLARSSKDASNKQTPGTGSKTTTVGRPQESDSRSTATPAAVPSGPPSRPADTTTSVGPSMDTPTRQTAGAESTSVSTESGQLQKDHGPPIPTPQTNLTELSSPPTAVVTSERSSAEVPTETPEGTRPQTIPVENHPPQEPVSPPQDADGAPKTSSHAGLPQRPDASDATAGAILPGDHLKPVANATRPVSGDWVVSETASPIDYTPLVTAFIRSTSQVKDTPNTLTIRCRGQHTELVVRTDGVWRAPHGTEMRGAYQINDQPAVSQRWMLSADGKSATYRDDVIGLLQALPDGARLKISIADQAAPSHEATFRLDSLDAVRLRIGKACQWPVTADGGLPRRR